MRDALTLGGVRGYRRLAIALAAAIAALGLGFYLQYWLRLTALHEALVYLASGTVPFGLSIFAIALALSAHHPTPRSGAFRVVQALVVCTAVVAGDFALLWLTVAGVTATHEYRIARARGYDAEISPELVGAVVVGSAILLGPPLGLAYVSLVRRRRPNRSVLLGGGLVWILTGWTVIVGVILPIAFMPE